MGSAQHQEIWQVHLTRPPAMAQCYARLHVVPTYSVPTIISIMGSEGSFRKEPTSIVGLFVGQISPSFSRDLVLDLFSFSSSSSTYSYHLTTSPHFAITSLQYVYWTSLFSAFFWIVLLSLRNHCSHCAPCLTLFFGDHLFACSNFGGSPYTLTLPLLLRTLSSLFGPSCKPFF